MDDQIGLEGRGQSAGDDLGTDLWRIPTPGVEMWLLPWPATPPRLPCRLLLACVRQHVLNIQWHEQYRYTHTSYQKQVKLEAFVALAHVPWMSLWGVMGFLYSLRYWVQGRLLFSKYFDTCTHWCYAAPVYCSWLPSGFQSITWWAIKDQTTKATKVKKKYSMNGILIHETHNTKIIIPSKSASILVRPEWTTS